MFSEHLFLKNTSGEHPCRSVISIKLQGKIIEITFRHGCSIVNLLHIFRTPFHKNTYGGLLLDIPYRFLNQPIPFSANVLILYRMKTGEKCELVRNKSRESELWKIMNEDGICTCHYY